MEYIDDRHFYYIHRKVIGTEEIIEVRSTEKFKQFMTFLKWNVKPENTTKDVYDKYYEEFMKTYKGY